MTKIAYLGPEGTFTEEALNCYLKQKKDIEKLPLPTVTDVVKYVDRGRQKKGWCLLRIQLKVRSISL